MIYINVVNEGNEPPESKKKTMATHSTRQTELKVLPLMKGKQKAQKFLL